MLQASIKKTGNNASLFSLPPAPRNADTSLILRIGNPKEFPIISARHIVLSIRSVVVYNHKISYRYSVKKSK
jgi:hypothetical protein